MRWLFLKDLRILRRSPLLVGLLVVYPVVIAVLIGLALSRAPDKPKVAFFNQVPPSASTFRLGGQEIDASKYANELFESVDPIEVHSRQEALDKVKSGEALAALIVPPDIVEKLGTRSEEPSGRGHLQQRGSGQGPLRRPDHQLAPGRRQRGALGQAPRDRRPGHRPAARRRRVQPVRALAGHPGPAQDRGHPPGRRCGRCPATRRSGPRWRASSALPTSPWPTSTWPATSSARSPSPSR